MGKSLALLLTFAIVLLAKSALAESVSINSQADIGNGAGAVRVSFAGINDGTLSGELIVQKISDSSIIQRIKVEGIFYPPDTSLNFEFIDLNDDGFKDMIFWNSRTGSAGAAFAGDVFLWVPKLKRFMQSQSNRQP